MCHARNLSPKQIFCFELRTIITDDNLWNAEFRHHACKMNANCEGLFVFERMNVERLGGIINSDHI